MLLGLSAARCSAPAQRLVEVVERIEVPAREGSAEPDLVVGADGRMYLSWIEPADATRHALRFSVWNGQSWSQARTIAGGDDWFVNWADFPSIAALADGTLAAHWLAKSADATYAYDVLLSVSRDGGLSWSEPVRPHRDGTPTEHGFVSLLPTADGEFVVVWLDGRRTGAADGGPMTLRFSTLAPNGTVAPDALLDDSVCDCCSTDAVVTGPGRVAVAYRDRTPSEIRDVAVVRIEGGKPSEPRTVHADNWQIGGCPVNGPALAVAGDRVGCAWFTMAHGSHGSVRLAFSNDGAASFGNPIELGLGDPEGRVDLVLDEDGSATVSWIERQGSAATINVRRVSPRGETHPATVVAATSVTRASGFPRLARYRGRTYLAWTETRGASTRVQTGVLPHEGDQTGPTAP